jgi:signal transduction histidine kinase
MTDETLINLAVDEAHLRFMRQMEPRSKMAVPLIARNRTLGVISFIATNESGRTYSHADLELAQELAHQAGQAIDNAWLYRQAQEAIQTQLELDRHKDHFLSIASHELRTPLTTIKGYSQILQRNLGRQEAGKASTGLAGSREVRILNNIVSQVGRMDALISEMLDVSRIQSGQFDLNLGNQVDLNELARRVVEQQQDAAPDHPLALQPARTNLTGNWDEARIEQVLNNLINNALKYSSPSQPVEIGLTQGDRPDEGLVWVRDQGIGISPEHQAHIFDRFYRARTPMNVNVDGLGLGLFISYETITRHGGRMWLESELGKGSTFYFALPLKTA